MARILFVDDDPTLRRILRAILEKAGHTITEAEDGGRALAAVGAGAPDVVLTDIVLPNREGVETVAELRKPRPQIPIIAMSGGGRSGPDLYLHMAKEMGATRTPAKPIRPSERLQTVAVCLEAERRDA